MFNFVDFIGIKAPAPMLYPDFPYLTPRPSIMAQLRVWPFSQHFTKTCLFKAYFTTNVQNHNVLTVLLHCGVKILTYFNIMYCII